MRAWILQRFRTYGQVVFMLSVASAPLLYSRSTLDTFDLVKLVAVWILGLLAVWLWATWSLERGIWIPRFKLLYSLTAFMGAFCLSAIFSQRHRISLIGIYHRYGGLIPKMLYVVMMLALIGLFWERPDGLKQIALIIAGAATIVSGYALIQAAGQDWVVWTQSGGGPVEGPVSTLGNSNFVGGFLAIALPFFVYFILASKDRLLKAAALGGLLFTGAALWFAGSRGGYLAGAAGLLFLALAYWKRLTAWAKAIIAAILLSGLVGGTVWISSARTREPADLTQTGVLRTNTLRIRQYYWSAAWRMFQDRPILGMGPDTYYANYPRYRLPKDGAQLGLALADKPHNIYLEYAANSGVLGAGAYVALAGLALFYGVRRSADWKGGPRGPDSRPTTSERHLAAGFTAAFVAYLVQGFFSIDVPPLALMGWVILGGLAVLTDPGLLLGRSTRSRILEEKLRSNKASAKGLTAPANVEIVGKPRPARQGQRRALQGAGAAIVVSLAALGMRPLAADAAAGAASAQAAAGEEQAAWRSIKKAIKLFPWESTYYSMAGDLAVRDQSRGHDDGFHRAVVQYLHAYRTEPDSVSIPVALAKLNARWAAQGRPARFSQADRWWRAAIRKDPTDWALKYGYGAFLSDWGAASSDERALRRSVSLLEEAAGLKPGEAGIWQALGNSSLKLGETAKARSYMQRALRLTQGKPRSPARLGPT